MNAPLNCIELYPVYNIKPTYEHVATLPHVGLIPTKDVQILQQNLIKSVSSIEKEGMSHFNEEQEKLDLSDISISGKDLQKIAAHISKYNKLRDLDLAHTKLDEVGVKAVSKIWTKASCLECINLHNCGLDEASLKVLAKAGKEVGKPLKELILSSNPGVSDSAETIAAIADKFKCEEIDISSNALDGEYFKELASTGAPAMVHTIRVCENPIDTWESVAMLVKNWNVKNLDASYCIMYLEDAQKFATAATGHKLSTLNLHHPDLCTPLAKKLRKSLKNIIDGSSLSFDCVEDA